MSRSIPMVPVTLDRIRQLKVDFNALCAMEEKSGKSVMKPNSWSNMKIADLRVMLWAGLRHEDKTLTLEQVGKMVTMTNMKDTMEAVTKAWSLHVETPGAPPTPLAQQAAVGPVLVQ